MAMLNNLLYYNGYIPTLIAIADPGSFWPGGTAWGPGVTPESATRDLLNQLKASSYLRFILQMYTGSAVDRLHSGASQAGVIGLSYPWFEIDKQLDGPAYFRNTAGYQNVANTDLATLYTTNWGFYEWSRSTDALRSYYNSYIP
jgi:hypothetical protein